MTNLSILNASTFVPSYQNANFSAQPFTNYLVDTSGGVVTATLPDGGPSTVYSIQFTDDAGTWGTNPLTIAPFTGDTIQGISGNGSLVCDLSGATVQLVWDITNGWWTVSSSGFQYANTGIVVPGTSAGLVAAAGLPGNTTGSAIANTYVGEVVTGSINTVTLTTSDSPISSTINLSAGIWLINYNVSMIVSAASTGAPFSQVTGTLNLHNGSGYVSGTDRSLYLQNLLTAAYNMDIGGTVSNQWLSNSNSATSWTVNGRTIISAGSGTVYIQNTTAFYSSFYAVRIA